LTDRSGRHRGDPGRADVSAAEAAALLRDPARLEPFSPLVAICLGVVGILAFTAFLVFGAFTRPTDRDLRGGSALSDAAVGFAGIVALLRAEGVQVTVSRASVGPGRRGLLVLTPPPTAALPLRLLDDHAGPVLVVLPKWRVQPLRGHPGWVESEGPLPTASAEHVLPVPVALRQVPGPHRTLHGGTGRLEGFSALPVGPIDPIQAVEVSADWTPVLLDEAGDPVLARWAGHRVYLLADPDLLDTHGLATPEGARSAVMVMDDLRSGGPVIFDITLDGFGAPPSLLRLLFEPPLIGATLCGGATGLLVLLMTLQRFGPAAVLDRVHDFGKRALADNSAALIALAGREARMALPYAQLIRGLALRDLNAPPRLDAAGADRLLDATSRSRGLADGWTALAALAAEVRSRADLTAEAGRLYRWRMGVTREDR